MMKRRILSAIDLFAILIPFMLIGGIPFRILVGIIAILGYKEIIELKGFKNYPKSVIVIGLIVLLSLVYSNRDILYLNLGLDYRYIVGSFLAMFIPTLFYFGKDLYTAKDAFKLTSFIMYLGIILNLLSNLLIYNRPYFILILLITILTDTFALSAGMTIGKHKFTKISPNKTLEGCVGGLVMGTALSTIYYVTFIGTAPLYKVIPVIAVLSIACEAGDLFFSLIKREHNIKDFSKLIPEHGGMLDRLDSLSFVMAMFVLLYGII